MANPQVEKGYIRIANDLWNEVLRRDFTKRQMNLILLIWRLSYGTGQKSCKVPNLIAFEQVGMYKQDIKKELLFLKQCAVLDWDENVMEFQINKEYHLWQVTPNKQWDQEKFNRLIHANLKRKRESEPRPSQQRQADQVSKSPTTSNRPVRKTRTLKLVKHLPTIDGKPMKIKDAAFLKKGLKTLKLKDIKEYNNSQRDHRFREVIDFYRDNLQKGITESPFNYELITQWYDEFGYDLVLEAMKIAANREAKGVRYIEGVLKNWQQANVKTLEDLKVLKKQSQTKRKSVFSKKRNAASKKDIVPEWYRQHKQERNQIGKQESIEEKEKKVEEIDQMLQEYLSYRGQIR
ncbi:replication protein [Gracilibacillus massiliensis]|uniref:replication protein n=1 Tax=Gracilibacillus massiliensis TaxID=1564956 RepID=UPI00071DE027|nr:replication protein [Gracilibacillus massiliensis]